MELLTTPHAWAVLIAAGALIYGLRVRAAITRRSR